MGLLSCMRHQAMRKVSCAVSCAGSDADKVGQLGTRFSMAAAGPAWAGRSWTRTSRQKNGSKEARRPFAHAEQLLCSMAGQQPDMQHQEGVFCLLLPERKGFHLAASARLSLA